MDNKDILTTRGGVEYYEKIATTQTVVQADNDYYIQPEATTKVTIHETEGVPATMQVVFQKIGESVWNTAGTFYAPSSSESIFYINVSNAGYYKIGIFSNNGPTIVRFSVYHSN